MPFLSPWRDTARALAFPLLVAFAAPAAGQQPAPQFSELAYPTFRQLDGQRWLSLRVVDAITGAPLPNAELHLIAESETPIRGEFRSELRVTADADGFVRIAAEGKDSKRRRWGWLMVRAPGYGQRMEMNWLDEVVALAPAIDMPVLVLDALDHPVADCLVGFCCGCGHTPDLVHARTNANGLCTLRGIDDRQGIRDLYLEHPRLGLLYDQRDWFPGEPPVRVFAPHGFVAQGVLVDERSKPVAGAFVGYMDVHRGPWTRTGVDGSFELCGITTDPTELTVLVGNRKLLMVLADTMPLRLQLPPAPPADEAHAPGYTEIVELPAGERSREQAITSAAPWPTPGWPTVLVRAIDLPADASIELVTNTHTLDIGPLVQQGAPVPVPDEPFAFVLEQNDQRRTFPFSRATALAAGIVPLRWFRPTRVAGQVVGPDGQPRAVELTLLPPDEAMRPDLEAQEGQTASPGAIALTSEREGLAMLAVVDPSLDCAPRIVPVLLPPRGDDVAVDLGTIMLTERPQYLLHDTDGELLFDWQVALLRRGFVTIDHECHVPLQRLGYAPLPDLQPGDVLHVEPTAPQPQIVDGRAEYTVPARFPVQGQGPWDFTLPAGQLRVNVRCDDAPDAPDAHVWLLVDDLRLDVSKPVLLRGLTPGRHRCFVTAAGHQTAIADVDVPTQSTAELELKLPPR